MHSFIILGNNLENIEKKSKDLLNKFKISSFNQKRVNQTATIKDVRTAIKSLVLNSSSNQYQALIIESIGKLALESQQTLLKTIEEPPLNTICIIQGNYSDSILPTIISRSQIITTIGNSHQIKDYSGFTSTWKPLLTSSSTTEKLNFSTTVTTENKERENLLNWLDQQIMFFRDLMYKRVKVKKEGALDPLKISTIIKNFLAAKRYISSNVNTKLVIDNLLLSLKIQAKNG